MIPLNVSYPRCAGFIGNVAPELIDESVIDSRYALTNRSVSTVSTVCSVDLYGRAHRNRFQAVLRSPKEDLAIQKATPFTAGYAFQAPVQSRVRHRLVVPNHRGSIFGVIYGGRLRPKARFDHVALISGDLVEVEKRRCT